MLKDSGRCFACGKDNPQGLKLDVRKTLRAGTSTFPLDLKGGDRFIRKVVLWYKTADRESKKAIVTIYGND